LSTSKEKGADQHCRRAPPDSHDGCFDKSLVVVLFYVLFTKGPILRKPVLARKVWLPWAPSSLYPNLFCVLCGKPGDRKSSTIKLAEHLAKGCLPAEAFLPKAFSPESLFDEYAVDCGGQADKILVADDANAILTDWHHSVNGERNATRFLDLYDCTELSEAFRRNKKQSKTGSSRRHIPETSTSVIFGATFNIARFQSQTVQAGLARRFLYYVAEELDRTIHHPKYDLKRFGLLQDKFADLARLSGPFQFNSEAEKLFNAFQDDNRKSLNSSDPLMNHCFLGWLVRQRRF
jgi:hypothetical protein